MIGFGQSWTYNSGGNDFDGKYRTSSVVGTGTDYPYNSPRLKVNFFENTEQINFYISDAGYFPSSSNTSVQLSFSNEKGTIYKSNSLGYSRDRKSVFLGDFFSPNNIKRSEIFQKLMTASYVNIRISNDYGKNDLNFSLKGSSRAIKFVIPFEEELEEENEIQMNDELFSKKANLKILKRDSLLRYHLKKYRLSTSLENTIINNLKFNTATSKLIENVDSLLLWKNNSKLLSCEVFYNYVTGYYKNVVDRSSYTFTDFVKVSDEDINSIPTYSELFKLKIKNKEISVLVKPNRKDFKSSPDYQRALRKYYKSID